MVILYGLGSPDNSDRKEKTCYKTHLQYLLSYHDKRFEKHYSFIFVVFNMLQRCNACYAAKLMMDQPYSESYAQKISKIKSSDVEEALQIIAKKGKETSFQINSDVSRLLKQIKTVGGNIPGSIQARSKLRVDIHSLIYKNGLPSIFITINPADTCSPVALYMAGVDIDLDKIIKETFPSGYTRSQTIASHPVSTAKYFNYLIKTILSTLIMGGVLGPMDSYFGTVESQGRGSLHLHMLLWLLHNMKPKDIMQKIKTPEFRASLLNFLEDIIKESVDEFTGEYKNTVPENIGEDVNLDETLLIKDILKYTKGDIPSACLLTPNPKDLDYGRKYCQDIINLVTESNIHRHNATCYKYARINDKSPMCRMRFPRAKIGNSSIDPDTGELKLRRTHEWLNNYNDTIISACRCNMDIEYIFSGKDAKALCYYITDYVTKNSLSFYDIFSLIHKATKIFEEQPQISTDAQDDIYDRSRRLILKCYNTIASKNELSGVQVASYLMNWGDHYTNKSFTNIFLIGIERYIQTGLDKNRNIKNVRNTNFIPIIETFVEHNKDNITVEEVPIDKNEEQFELQLSDDGSNFILINQRVDYENRPNELENICLYKFVSKYRKKRKDKSDEIYLLKQTTKESNINKKGRPAHPRLIFKKTHPQMSTHILIERLEEIIPVLIGPQIPRQNREETRERYCRSILTLFKPWRTFTDLIFLEETWNEAWTRHTSYIYESDCTSIIDNIELMHECKEHRNEHLTQVIEQLQNTNIEPPFYAHLDNDSESDDECNDDFLNLINMWDNLGDNIIPNSDYINVALDSLTTAKRFEINQKIDVNLKSQDTILNINEDEIKEIHHRKIYSNIKSLLPATNNLYEMNKHWQLCLKIQKEKIRKQILYGETDEIEKNTSILVPSNIDNHKLGTVTAPDVVIGTTDMTTQKIIISRYTLNKEQIRAFMIITDHLDDKSFLNPTELRQEQLIMCVPASAGTGKSHLIKALTEYFRITKRLSMLRKLAPTSVAANQMGQGGLTMQSFLHCRLQNNLTQNRKSTIEMEWKHIKYIFLDELSMIGLDTIAKLHRLMSIAREDWADSSIPFGGKNIVFYGDILQYKPILDLPVYTNLLDPGEKFKTTNEILKENIEKHDTAEEIAEKKKKNKD